MVVGGRHLDHVDAGHGEFHGGAAHGVEELAAGEPARLRRARARGGAGVHHVDVDRQKDGVAPVGGDGERLGQAGRQSACLDLGHLEAPHPLARHPGERVGIGPVAAQADLQEAVATRRPGLDEPSHRRPVPVHGAELGVRRVGVGVEMDDGDPAPPDVPGDAGDIGQGDGVVPSQDHRYGARPRQLLDGVLQALQRLLDLARGHLDVAHVDHAQLDQRVHAQCQMGPLAVVREVVGEPDRLGAETASRPIRGAAVEGRSEYHRPGTGVAAGFVQPCRGDSGEGGFGPVHLRRHRGHSSPRRRPAPGRRGRFVLRAGRRRSATVLR